MGCITDGIATSLTRTSGACIGQGTVKSLPVHLLGRTWTQPVRPGSIVRSYLFWPSLTTRFVKITLNRSTKGNLKDGTRVYAGVGEDPDKNDASAGANRDAIPV